MCLTETHSWRDNDQLTIYSDPPPKADSWSGVALLVNKTVSKFVIDSGPIGSRITYCRLKGNTTNYFVIGTYIPQRKRHNPNQNDVYDQLDGLLGKIPKHDCVILMGDFNSRLSRNEAGFVGRWCIHTRRDSGGDRLLEIMKKYSLRSISTYFQPRRRHSNATFMNIQPEKPASQIDYIFVGSRWSTAARQCSTDFSALRKPEILKAHSKTIEAELAKTPRPELARDQLQRLNKIMRTAQSSLPKKNLNPNRKWKTSEHTLMLVEQRKRTWENLNADQRKELIKEISRSARNDYRNHMESIVEEMEQMNAVGKISETFRLAKRISSKGKTKLSTQPSADEQGIAITSNEQQLELWAKFAAQAEEPEVILYSEVAVPLPTFDEVESCVKHQKKEKATGPDDIPIEQYQHSKKACEELHQVILTIWDSEDVPEEMVLGDMMMIYKKKSKDIRANYRALGLLNHSYKTFSMVLLTRIVPLIDPKLSDMQAGFQQGRGCLDNILILTMAIHRLLRDTNAENQTA